MSNLHVHDIEKDDNEIMYVEIRNDSNDLQIFARCDGSAYIYKYRNGLNPDNCIYITEEDNKHLDSIYLSDIKDFIDELQQVLSLTKDAF